MSHHVIVDYEGRAIRCCEICGRAEEVLNEIDLLIESIESNSSSLLDETTEKIKKSLLEEKNAINEEILRIHDIAKKQIELKKFSTYSGNVELEASQLLKRCNSLSSEKILKYETYINSTLISKINEKLDAKNRSMEINSFNKKLDAIKDETLKNYVYFEYCNPDNYNKSFDELVELANKRLNKGVQNTLEKKKDTIIKNAISKLKENKVDEKKIKEITNLKTINLATINELNEKVNNEIVDERVRKETIKCIIKIVEKRGFIVDRKNIKLQKDKNQVVFIAQKVNGQVAEFKVFLDGKFIYKFVEGYEGQACQNDIKPFLSDLEEIYGIKIKKSETIWSNPDKLSTKKYQNFKENKNNI